MNFRDRQLRCAHSTLTIWLASLLVLLLLDSMPTLSALAAQTEASEAETSQEQEAEPAEESGSSEENSEPTEEAEPATKSESAPDKDGDQQAEQEPVAQEESAEQTKDSEGNDAEKTEPEKKQADTSKQDEPAEPASKGPNQDTKETTTESNDSKSKESAEASVETERTMEIESEQPVEKDPEPPKETPKETKKEKCIIGSTATLLEKQSGLKFRARVDTGAKSCSLHVEKIEIQDESTKEDIVERMTENIGKVITFVVKNGDGKTHILKRKIASYVIIKTSDKTEGKRRYKVPLTFLWKNMEKEVLVTLNNRKHMDYPLLIGRNFLRGDFLVDVELNSDD